MSKKNITHGFQINANQYLQKLMVKGESILGTDGLVFCDTSNKSIQAFQERCQVL